MCARCAFFLAAITECLKTACDSRLPFNEQWALSGGYAEQDISAFLLTLMVSLDTALAAPTYMNFIVFC